MPKVRGGRGKVTLEIWSKWPPVRVLLGDLLRKSVLENIQAAFGKKKTNKHISKFEKQKNQLYKNVQRQLIYCVLTKKWWCQWNSWERERDREGGESWRVVLQVCRIESAHCASDVLAGEALHIRNILLSLRILTNNSSLQSGREVYWHVPLLLSFTCLFQAGYKKTTETFSQKTSRHRSTPSPTADPIKAVHLSHLLSAFSKGKETNNPHCILQPETVALPFLFFFLQ